VGNYAVEVVGAGIAGPFIAWSLAKRGWNVALVDVLENPWHRPCGGLVSSNALREFSFLKKFVLRRIDGARIHAGKETMTVERNRVAYVLDRENLVRFLIESSASAGASVFLGRRGPAYNAMVTVGADGALSTVRMSLGIPLPRRVIALQRVVRGRFDHMVDVFFLKGCSFFGWIIPLSDNRALAGVATEGDPRPFLRKLTRLARVKSVGKPEGRPIPVDAPLRNVVYGTTALVGDAVPHTKATTGGGIYYGLKAARYLSDAIHMFFSTGSMGYYQKAHMRYLYPHLQMHHLLRRLIEKKDMELIIRDAKEYGLDEALSKYGDMDKPFFVLRKEFWFFMLRTFSPYGRILRKLYQSQ